MKIVICASINFTNEIKKVADILSRQGHKVEIPFYTQRILRGEDSLENFVRIKEKDGDLEFRNKSSEDLIKRYFRLIKDSDAILIVNIDKKGIKNYIGGNTFLEIGFAHILNKKIFLLNPIPETSYTDEIKAMQPIVLDNDLNKIN